MLKMLSKLPMALAVVIMQFASAAQAIDITVYTTNEVDDQKRYDAAFRQKYPDININYVYGSSGEIIQRLIDEADNRKADMIWGIASSSMIILKRHNILAPYKPKGLERIDRRFRDPAPAPFWVGLDAWASAVCVNKNMLAAKNIPMPTTWQDLTKPEFRGQIIAGDPGLSGTMFMHMSAWMQLMGEREAWQYMRKLDKNVQYYVGSGSKPCRIAADGKAMIGISYGSYAAKVVGSGKPIEIMVPSEGVGWEGNAAAIVAGTDKLATAQKIVDFAISKEAMQMYNKSYPIISVPAEMQKTAHYPDIIFEKLIDNDFDWASKSRARIIKKWQRRYAKKTKK